VDSVPLLEETVFLAVGAGTHASASDGADSGAGAGDPVAGSLHADWIAGTPGTLCHTVTLRICQTAGFTPAVRHHTDDFTAVLALVAAGQGVALVPQLGAAQPSPDVRLLPLPTRRRTRVAYRRGAGSHPTVAAFVQAIRASAGAYLRAPS
jgi:DNA-binding transcriptional LysR family regulator